MSALSLKIGALFPFEGMNLGPSFRLLKFECMEQENWLLELVLVRLMSLNSVI